MNRECRNCAHAELPPYAQSSLKGGLYCREAVRLKMPPIGKVRLPDDVCCNFRPYTEKGGARGPEDEIQVGDAMVYAPWKWLDRIKALEEHFDTLSRSLAKTGDALAQITGEVYDRLSKLEGKS